MGLTPSPHGFKMNLYASLPGNSKIAYILRLCLLTIWFDYIALCQLIMNVLISSKRSGVISSNVRHSYYLIRLQHGTQPVYIQLAIIRKINIHHEHVILTVYIFKTK